MPRVLGCLVVFATACGFTGHASVGPEDAPVVDAMVYLDAPVLAVCNETLCTSVMGTCNAVTGHCEIKHSTGGAVACPATLYCDIECSGGPMACIGGINCLAADGCNIFCGDGKKTDACSDGDVVCPATGPCNVNCNGDSACRNHGVKCGGGRCDVRCTGTQACQTGVACRGSTDCHAQCRGDNACRNGGVSCGLGVCDVTCEGKNACVSGACTTAPSPCTFSCCGMNACSGATTVCATCTRDDSC